MDEKENILLDKVTDVIFNYNKRVKEIEDKINGITPDAPLKPTPPGFPPFKRMGNKIERTFELQQQAAEEKLNLDAELGDLLKDQEPDKKKVIIQKGKDLAYERAEDYKSLDNRQDSMDAKIEDYKSTKTFDPATYSPSQDLKFESRQELLEGYTNNAIDIEFDRD